MDIKYNITYHAVERLQERFGAFCSKLPLLKNWKREQGLSQLKPLFNQMLDLSEENKSYQNNSAYMLKLYEKYGYDNEYCFLEFKEENILFLLTKPRSSKEYLLVTLMPTEYRPGVKNIKYSGKEDRQVSFNKFLMNWSKTEVVLSNKFNLPNIRIKPTNPIKQSSPVQKTEVKTKTEKEVIQAPTLDKETQLLHNQLISSIKNNAAIQVERYSNSKAMYMTAIEDKQYEFTYSKSSSGIRTVVIHNIEQLNLNNPLKTLDPKKHFYQALLKAINNNEAVLTPETTSEQKVYKVQLYNNVHNVSLIDNGTETPKMIMQQKQPVTTNVVVNHEELKSSGEKLKETDPLYVKLMEATNNQNFRVIEKYSITTSLRVTTIDDTDYQYVYIRKNNKKDRDIILQDTRVAKNASVESFKSISQLAEQSLTNSEKPQRMRM